MENKNGMYNETEKFNIGRFELSKQADGRIWISDGDEDGGEFGVDDLEAAIEEFYNKNF